MTPADGAETSAQLPSLRLDKWLWHARACRTRTAATKLAGSGQVRVNGSVTTKAHTAVRPGDVLTFPQGDHIRIWRIVELAARRGSASLAQAWYEDLKPPTSDNRLPRPAPSGGGRPDARQRRQRRALAGKED
ncbi:MAG: hypothetical protein Kilf2KO_29350 [Rhodospirillales bacterium]